jgi:glycosidase
VARNYRKVNVDRLKHKPTSTLTLYHHLLAVRNRDETMVKGIYKEHLIDDKKNVLVYERNYEATSYIVALNFSGKVRRVRLPYLVHHIVLSTLGPTASHTSARGWVTLRPFEGVILLV